MCEIFQFDSSKRSKPFFGDHGYRIVYETVTKKDQSWVNDDHKSESSAGGSAMNELRSDSGNRSERGGSMMSSDLESVTHSPESDHISPHGVENLGFA